jgi:hypothetical protein
VETEKMPMQLRLQFQENAVADEVAAVTAVVRPILEGLLYGLKREAADDAGATRQSDFDNYREPTFRAMVTLASVLSTRCTMR